MKEAALTHARKGASPYSAQLRKLLSSEGRPSAFSAVTLRDRFEIRPNEQLRTTINKIHQALRKAWEAEEVVADVGTGP